MIVLKKTTKKILIIFLALTLGILSFACKENSGDFTLGEEFIESKTNLISIDTFSVKLSTVIFDTISTNGTETMLLGCCNDENFGKIVSCSYFQLGIPESFDIETNEKFDSISLIIRYSGYSYGDTTKSQKISVHQLLENIELNEDDLILSKTSFNFNSTEIGSLTYTPQPHNTIDSLSIRISDEIGYGLFNKMEDISDFITDEETFINYFKGLVLVADENYEGAIIGFNASEDDIYLKIYTSVEDLSTVEKTYVLGLANIEKQFNNYNHNYSATRFSNLSKQEINLSNNNSNNLSFLQASTGLAIRVDFPSLEELLLFERSTIMEAQLFISPLENSFSDYPLPPQLVLYGADNKNRITEVLYTNLGTTVYSSLNMEDLYPENFIYTFDITKYINDELADSYIDPEQGIIITLPSQYLTSSFYRFIADANSENTKLKIYFLTY